MSSVPPHCCSLVRGNTPNNLRLGTRRVILPILKALLWTGCRTTGYPVEDRSGAEAARVFAAGARTVRIDSVRLGMRYDELARIRPAARDRRHRGLAEAHGPDSLVFYFDPGRPGLLTVDHMEWVTPEDDAPLRRVAWFRRVDNDAEAQGAWRTRLVSLRGATPNPVRCFRTRTRFGTVKAVPGLAALVQVPRATSTASASAAAIRLWYVAAYDGAVRGPDGAVLWTHRVPASLSLALADTADVTVAGDEVPCASVAGAD